MSCTSASQYSVPAKWITVDFQNGTSAYFELNASGSLKYLMGGIPIPSYIQPTHPSWNGNQCCTSSSHNDDPSFDEYVDEFSYNLTE
jgi:hypothetical protein